MSNEDLSPRRGESNFHYASRIKQYNLEKEQEKHNRTREMQYEKVMNRKTDRTSLHHSNSSIFQDSDVLAVKDIYSATIIGEEILELMKETMPTMNLKRRTAGLRVMAVRGGSSACYTLHVPRTTVSFSLVPLMVLYALSQCPTPGSIA